MSNTGSIEQRLGFIFNKPGLLIEALTHPSCLNENLSLCESSYQRLEFLGDAILGWVTAEELFKRYPESPEGDLTRIRSHLVQESFLAGLALDIGLDDDLRMGRGEEASGGRKRHSNLACTFEALIAAVYLDQGIETTKTLVIDLLRDEMERVELYGVPQDPKSTLQEVVQARFGIPPDYRVVNKEGPAHDQTFTVEVLMRGDVIGVGRGKRKLDAEREAAEMAIQKLS